MEGIGGLFQRRVALHLLRKAGHGCTVVYDLRTIPRDITRDFVQEFDENLRSTFETVVGLPTADEQWEQAGLRVQQSGLGLPRHPQRGRVSQPGPWRDGGRGGGGRAWGQG